MVHISSISKDFVRFDAATETMNVGTSRFKVGSEVKVFTVRVDFPARRLDFAYVPGTLVDKWAIANEGKPALPQRAGEKRRAAAAERKIESKRKAIIRSEKRKAERKAKKSPKK